MTTYWSGLVDQKEDNKKLRSKKPIAAIYLKDRKIKDLNFVLVDMLF